MKCISKNLKKCLQLGMQYDNINLVARSGNE